MWMVSESLQLVIYQGGGVQDFKSHPAKADATRLIPGPEEQTDRVQMCRSKWSVSVQQQNMPIVSHWDYCNRTTVVEMALWCVWQSGLKPDLWAAVEYSANSLSWKYNTEPLECPLRSAYSLLSNNSCCVICKHNMDSSPFNQKEKLCKHQTTIHIYESNYFPAV